MDAVGDLPQVDERLPGLLLQPHELDGVELAALQPVAGQPEPGDEGDDVLLDAVMEVSFDAAPLVILGHDQPRPRCGQLFQTLLELGGEGDIGDRGRRLARHRREEIELVRRVVASSLRAQVDPADPAAARGRGRGSPWEVPVTAPARP